MPTGSDQQYDENWTEQDKIRRRAELRRRLKMEAIDRKYNPFNNMKGHVYSDPALDRYGELRKYGRMPGAPFKASIFFTLLGFTLVPIVVGAEIIRWERKDWLKGMRNGDIPYEQRDWHCVV